MDAEAQKPVARPRLLLDSSPLITLALFPVHQPAIQTVLSVADVLVVDTVAEEVTAQTRHRDAKVIAELLKSGQIQRHAVPTTSMDDLIDAYARIEVGERNTIRLALTLPEIQLVLDDTFAFITAAHFGLTPIMLLDLLANWGLTGLLDRQQVLRIVSAISSRYSEAFVNHTYHKLQGT